MAKSFEVDVKPEILIWARTTLNREISDVAKQLNVNEKIVERWESGDKRPTLNQLKTLSKYYKRPLAAFFLPEPPEELPPPRDFRKLPKGVDGSLSPKTILAMRRARRLQSIASELDVPRNTRIRYSDHSLSLRDDPEIEAPRIRNTLKITVQEQSEWDSDIRALDQWKRAVENFGIVVFQLPMDIMDARAFSLTDGEKPIIVLNKRDSPRGRIFSLFHELAHILLNEGGMCNMRTEEIFQTGSRDIEIFCNHFAGALLVPKENLLYHRLVKGKTAISEWPLRTLGTISNHFFVSKEVILRRLVIFKKAPKSFYGKMHEIWEEAARKDLEKKGGGGGGRNIAKECIDQCGTHFISTVLDQHKKERITYSDVSDYLGIRLKYLPKVEQLSEARS